MAISTSKREIIVKSGLRHSFLRVGIERTGQSNANWPRNPRALAGQLRRAQTFLRAIGIEIAFGREGRAGNRIIRIRSCCDETGGTVTTVSSVSVKATQPQARPAVG
jgi:hypothetical protein